MIANFWRALEALNEAERKFWSTGRPCQRWGTRWPTRENEVWILDVDRTVVLCRSFGVSRGHIARALGIQRQEVDTICRNAKDWFHNYAWGRFVVDHRSLSWL